MSDPPGKAMTENGSAAMMLPSEARSVLLRYVARVAATPGPADYLARRAARLVLLNERPGAGRDSTRWPVDRAIGQPPDRPGEQVAGGDVREGPTRKWVIRLIVPTTQAYLSWKGSRFFVERRAERGSVDGRR